MEESLETTFDLQPTAEEVGIHIQEIYNEVQRGLGQLVDSSLFAETAQPKVAGWVTTAEDIADDVTGIAQLHTTEDYSDDVMSLEGAVERANQVADRAAGVHGLSQSLNSEAQNLIGGLGQISDDVTMLSSSVEDIEEELRRVQSSLETSTTETSSLIQDVDVINDIVDRAETEIGSLEQVISQTNLTGVCEAVHQLSAWIGMETREMPGSGTEPEGPLTPGSGDGIEPEVSGSGMGPEAEDSLTDQVTLLERGVGDVGVALGVAGGVVNSSVNYSLTLQQQAESICRYIHIPFSFNSLSLSLSLSEFYQKVWSQGEQQWKPS